MVYPRHSALPRSCWILICLLLPAACDRRPPDGSIPSPAHDSAATRRDDLHGVRIVSLAPALTQMLVDLGLANAIVGVAEHDDAAPPGRPVIGHFMDINTERLYGVRPTHVVMMTGKDGVPDSMRALAKSLNFDLIAYPYPNSVAEVGTILFDERELLSATQQPDTRSLAAAFGLQRQAITRKNQFFQQLGGLDRITGERPRPTVLMAISLEPTVMASGPGTVHDSLLRFAGGVNAAADTASTAPVYDREKLLTLNPEVILLLLPSLPSLRAADDPRLALFRGLEIDAVRNRRIYLINDPLVVLPSTSLPRVAAAMAKAIHPDLAAEIDRVMNSIETSMAEPEHEQP